MGINLGTQAILFALWPFFPLTLGMASGTATGLITKYVLDKRYIFHFQPVDRKEDGKRFVGYTLMGIGTTLLFWGIEWFFDHFFSFPNARFAGGALGLTLGYWTKYHLDKRFVFRSNT